MRCGTAEMEVKMGELPPGHIEVPMSQHKYPLWLTPEIHGVLRIYARQNNISAIDAGNRIILGFFTEFHHFEDPNKLVKGTHKVIFPNSRAIHDAIVSIARGERPHRRPLPLRRNGKLPFASAESVSSDPNSL